MWIPAFASVDPRIFPGLPMDYDRFQSSWRPSPFHAVVESMWYLRTFRALLQNDYVWHRACELRKLAPNHSQQTENIRGVITSPIVARIALDICMQASFVIAAAESARGLPGPQHGSSLLLDWRRRHSKSSLHFPIEVRHC